MKQFLILCIAIIFTISVNGQDKKCLEITNLNPIDFIEESKLFYNHYFLVKSISDTVAIESVRTSGLQASSFKKRILLPGQSDTIIISSPLQGRIGRWDKSIDIFTNKCTQRIYTRFTVLHPAGHIPYAIFDPTHDIRWDTLYPNMNWYGIRVKDYPYYESYTDIDGHLITCKYWGTEPNLEYYPNQRSYEIKRLSPVFTKKNSRRYSVSFPYSYLYQFVIGVSKPLITEDSVYYREDYLIQPEDSLTKLGYNFSVYRQDTSVILGATSNKGYRIYYKKVPNNYHPMSDYNGT